MCRGSNGAEIKETNPDRDLREITQPLFVMTALLDEACSWHAGQEGANNLDQMVLIFHVDGGGVQAARRVKITQMKRAARLILCAKTFQ